MDDIVYAVEWIEIEFGRRPEGYKIFLDIETCTSRTKYDSKNGAGSGGYIGPERPLGYYEVPWHCLEPNVQKGLRNQVNKSNNEIFAFTTTKWKPHLKSDFISID